MTQPIENKQVNLQKSICLWCDDSEYAKNWRKSMWNSILDKVQINGITEKISQKRDYQDS